MSPFTLETFPPFAKTGTSGEAQLDFIPLPVSSPSAPSEQSLMIPDADEDAKYETQDLDRRPSCST
ncbi:MAG: hypothetical protein BYD32DRAFT_460773 [Podila humilis]|nr:MAG: hypothetical protein BYD32DRAFT_460773 [Podila humilis]